MSACEAPALRRPRLTVDYQRIVNAVFAAFVFFGMLSLVEPSPYDFLALVAIPLWFIGGFRLHKALVPILAMWALFEAAGFLSLMPYWNEHDAQLYQLQSFYLFVTTVFFTIFFSERTEQRASLCLKAFTAGAIVSAFVGFIGYFNVGGFGAALTTYEGRVSGTFKDPNVFGSYLVLAAAYLLQILLLGTTRRVLLSGAGLVVVVLGVFVSFSRGSWAALLGALILVVVSGFLTAQSRHLRRRIVGMTAVATLVGLLVLGALLSVPDVRNFFFQRAEVAQDYDEGVTGRFGNQIRSLPMLVERPEGFGPLRFRLIFGLEPHNSYIGGFANDGWIGGFTWIAIVLVSCFVGFRLMFVRSPFQRLAQVYASTMFVLLVQGLQIDVDHWRQLFLCFGAVWGLETARLRWSKARGGESVAATASPTGADACVIG